MAVFKIHRSAFKHGCDESTIRHALDYAIVVSVLDVHAEGLKMVAVGPDHAGNLLEIIWVEDDEDTAIVIHAMPVRAALRRLLPRKDGGIS